MNPNLNHKNILFVSSPKTWRGGEQQLAYLLQAVKQAQIPFTLLCSKNSKLHQLAITNHWNVAVFSWRGLLNIGITLKIWQLHSKKKISLIHANDSHAHSASIFAYELGVKLPIILARRVMVPIKKSVFSQKKYLHPAVQSIVCVSKGIAEIVEKSLTKTKNIEVVYSGIDFTKFKPPFTDFNLKTKYTIPAHHKVIAMVAAYTNDKDYTTYIRAAALFIHNNPDVHFLAVGEGDNRVKMTQLIEHLGIENHFILTGFVKEIVPLLQQIDIFVLSSFSEGLGTSVLDAFYVKKPVVASQTGGLKELVHHQKTGLLFEVGNSKQLALHLKYLIKHPEKATTLSLNAFKFVQKFSSSAMSSGYIEIFKRYW